MGISTALAIASTAGSLAGSLGKGKSSGSTQQSKQGFEARPEAVKSYMLDDMFPRIQELGDKPYQGMLKRALDETDTDPIFGSKRRAQYDQGIRDKLRNDLMYGSAPAAQESQDAAKPVTSQFLSGLKNTASRASPRGELLAKGVWSNDLAAQLERGNQGAIAEVLAQFGFNDGSLNTQNISPHMITALIRASGMPVV